MCNKLLAVAVITLVWLLFGCGAKDTAAPKVNGTNPQTGAVDVDPALTEIWVKFNEPMMDKGWSWCYEDESMYPKTTGDPVYSDDNTKCTLPVKLEPGKEYVIWINTPNIREFKDKAGNPAEPYKLTFKTK